MDHEPLIIREDEVENYRAQGYKAFDPHVHTSVSEDTIPAEGMLAERMYERMLAEGFDYVTFTDHDTADAYTAFEQIPAQLVRGAELSIRPKRIAGYTRTHTLHVNVYDFSDEQLHVLIALAQDGDLPALSAYLRAEDIPAVYNHPTWAETGEIPQWESLIEIVKYFDVIEAYNHSQTPMNNRVACLLTKAFGKGAVSGSDTHIAQPMRATLARGETFREFWENIRSGACLLVEKHLTHESLALELKARLRQVSDADGKLLRTRLLKLAPKGGITGNVLSLLISVIFSDALLKRKLNGRLLKMLYAGGGRYYANRVFLTRQEKAALGVHSLLFD